MKHKKLILFLALFLIGMAYMISQYTAYKKSVHWQAVPWDSGWDKIPENAPPVVVMPRQEVNKMIVNQERMMRQLGVTNDAGTR